MPDLTAAPQDDGEEAVSKADHICFVLDALRLLQSEHALSQLAMHFIACALARAVGECASEVRPLHLAASGRVPEGGFGAITTSPLIAGRAPAGGA